MILIVLLAFFSFACIFLANHLNELGMMINAMQLFFAQLPDYISWLPATAVLALVFVFGGIIVLRVLGRM